MRIILDRPADKVVKPHKVLPSVLRLGTSRVDPDRVRVAGSRELDVARPPAARVRGPTGPVLVDLVVVPPHTEVGHVRVEVSLRILEIDLVVLVKVVLEGAGKGHTLARLGVLPESDLKVVVELVGLQDGAMRVAAAKRALKEAIRRGDRLIPGSVPVGNVHVAVGDGDRAGLGGGGAGRHGGLDADGGGVGGCLAVLDGSDGCHLGGRDDTDCGCGLQRHGGCGVGEDGGSVGELVDIRDKNRLCLCENGIDGLIGGGESCGSDIDCGLNGGCEQRGGRSLNLNGMTDGVDLGLDIHELLSSSDLHPCVSSLDTLEGDVIGDGDLVSDISHVRVGGEVCDGSLIHGRRVNSSENVLGNCLLAEAGGAIDNHRVSGSLALGDGDDISHRNSNRLPVDSSNSSGLANDGGVIGPCLDSSAARSIFIDGARRKRKGDNA